MLNQAATVFEERTETRLKVVSSILPVAMVLVAACVNGFVMAGVLLPYPDAGPDRTLDMKRTRNPKLIRAAVGFTLIEMIVVVIIIAVLATAIGPALLAHRRCEDRRDPEQRLGGGDATVNLYQADTDLSRIPRISECWRLARPSGCQGSVARESGHAQGRVGPHVRAGCSR